MASLGHLPEFTGSAAEWNAFAEQLSFYFTVNGITNEEKQWAILVSACGTTTYKLFKTLVAPTELMSKSFSDLVKLAQEHHNPKPSVIMHRFRFNMCVHQEVELITAFVTRLRDLASHCKYGDSAKELTRDRLVCGAWDDTLQCALLAVAKLTFDKAFELALLHKSAAQNACLLSNPSSLTPVHFADRPGLPKDPPSKKSCYHCGWSHYTKDFHFKETVCNSYHKKGHIQRVCHSQIRHWQLRSPQPPSANYKQKSKGEQTHKSWTILF